jgi:hypothetical protein
LLGLRVPRREIDEALLQVQLRAPEVRCADTPRESARFLASKIAVAPRGTLQALQAFARG